MTQMSNTGSGDAQASGPPGAPPSPPDAGYVRPRWEPPPTRWTDVADAIEQLMDGVIDRADLLLTLAQSLVRLVLTVIVMIGGVEVIHILSGIDGVVRLSQTWLTSHSEPRK